ncbi:hypothetical protein ACXJJ3_03575 [Kribbella sp. WER1]
MTTLWLGGPAASGKTTISRLFARKHGYVWYSVDAHAFLHEERAAAAGLHDPTTGPGTFDRRPMILEDLQTLPTKASVIVEGAFVTPAVAGTGPNALWLMPTKPEQLTRLRHRNPDIPLDGMIWGWQLIQDQLEATNATAIQVDNQSVAQTLAAVEQHFAPYLTHPAPDTPARQSLIRQGNTQLATQARTRNPTAALTFDCECGTPTCTAQVEAPADALPPDKPLLSPTHHTTA